MKITQREISSIKPYEKNPRLNDDAVEAVAASIREFGFRQAIVVDPGWRDHRRAYSGTRRRCSWALKRFPFMSPWICRRSRSKRTVLADNRTGELATWDWDQLKFELGDLQDAEFNLDLLAFNDEELYRLLEER